MIFTKIIDFKPKIKEETEIWSDRENESVWSEECEDES